MIDVILSPDLKLEEFREAAKIKRIAAAERFAIGETVKAGATGKPGVLESISETGFAAIRWDDGSVLCGVEADRLMYSDPMGDSPK